MHRSDNSGGTCCIQKCDYNDKGIDSSSFTIDLMIMTIAL